MTLSHFAVGRPAFAPVPIDDQHTAGQQRPVLGPTRRPVTSSTGDPYLAALDPTAAPGTALTLTRGHTATIHLTLTPTAPKGRTVTGVLHLLRPRPCSTISQAPPPPPPPATSTHPSRTPTPSTSGRLLTSRLKLTPVPARLCTRVVFAPG